MLLQPTSVVIIVLSVLLVIAAIKMFYRIDDRVEIRRKKIIKLIGILNKVGLDDFIVGAEDYAVGDYSGLMKDVENLIDRLLDPEKATAMFSHLFYDQLRDRITDPLEKAKILEEIAKATAPAVAAK